MDFLEKIGEVAKNVKEKASDSIEINRINGDVFTAKRNIELYQQKLGEYYWAKFVMGEELEPEAVEICEKIIVCQDNIRRGNAEIAEIKARAAEAAQNDKEKPV